MYAHEAFACCSVCLRFEHSDVRCGPKKISKAAGHNQCPLGYVNTLGATCVSPINYEMQPTDGEACPSRWMNVGASYCRKK